MNRISTFVALGIVGTVGMTGCSGGTSKPAADGTVGSTTSISRTDTPGTAGTPGTSGTSATSAAPGTPSPSGPTGTASSPPPTPTASASSPAAAPSHAGGGACTTAEMPAGSWKVVEGSQGAGHVAADIAFRNTSTHPCTVTGYPAIQQLASDEHPLPTTVVHFPAPVTTVTVAPGAWIHSEIRYSPNIPGEGEPSTGNCEPETVHAKAQLPGDPKWATVTLANPTTVCEKGRIEAKPFAAGPSSPIGG